jgi:Glycosyl transferase family 2
VTLDVSYVIPTDTFDTIRDAVHAVARQTIADRVELVLVCPSSRELQLGDVAVRGIGAVRVVEVGSVGELSAPRAAGIRAASCPLVFIGESHSFPAPDCLDHLVAAHRSGDYAAVMPVIENANPEKAGSWATLMLTYRDWLEPAQRGEIRRISTYNACLRRDLLLAFGDRLDSMLDYGSGLDADLVARGGRLLIDPSARVAHLNVAGRGLFGERYLSGRFWAVGRARRWSKTRRLVYIAGAPLLPVVIAGKALRSTQWAHHREQMPRGTLAAILVMAVAAAAGEVTGYIAGAGRAPGMLSEYELHRERYV